MENEMTLPAPPGETALPSEREAIRAEAFEQAGMALQQAWDASETLPPIDFSPDEREYLARAVLNLSSTPFGDAK